MIILMFLLKMKMVVFIQVAFVRPKISLKKWIMKNLTYMNMYNFKKTRAESIESLQFYYFIKKVFRPLLSQYRNSSNSLILDFLKELEALYAWEYRKIEGYLQALQDSVFWESREFYRHTMVKFVNGEFTVLEFSQEFFNRLLIDQDKANDLVKDFKKQADIELNPKSFQFSNIILSFEIMLEVYPNEMEDFETKDQVPENDLSFKEDLIREEVKIALEEVNKYFTD